MALRELTGPFKGAANNTTYLRTPLEYAPVSALQNVRVRRPGTGRPGWAPRPGLASLASGTFGNGNPVQAFAVIPKASGVTGYRTVSTALVGAGNQRTQAAISGNVWMRDADTGIMGSFKDLGTQTAGDTIIGAFHARWIAGTTRVVFINQLKKTSTGKLYLGVCCYETTDGSLVWRTFLDDRDSTNMPPVGAKSDVGRDIVANGLSVDPVAAPYVYITTGGYVWVLNKSTGEYLWRYDVDGWAFECQHAIRQPYSAGRLLVLFDGSPVVSAPATWTNYDNFARFWRAGIAGFTVNSAATPPLSRGTFGTQLDSSDPLYENHGTVRLSEKLLRRPRGARTFGFAVCPSASTSAAGKFAVSFTNRGWGPNSATYQPDGSQAPTTVAMFDANGNYLWEADTDSLVNAYAGAWGTFYNDIPLVDGPAGPSTSINALGMDNDGDVYAAGTRNLPGVSDGYNVFKLSGADGTILWAVNLSGTIYQHCVCVDPQDGNVWVFGERNSNWTGASGVNAHGWKLSSSSGAVLKSVDLGSSPGRAFSIDVNTSGQLLYTTDTI